MVLENEGGDVIRIQMPQDYVNLRALVLAVLNLQVSYQHKTDSHPQDLVMSNIFK